MCVCGCTYKAITFGSPCVLVCDNNSFKDLTKLLKVPPHCVSLSLPSQSTNKDFSKSCVIVVVMSTTTHHLELPWMRHIWWEYHRNKSKYQTCYTPESKKYEGIIKKRTLKIDREVGEKERERIKETTMIKLKKEGICCLVWRSHQQMGKKTVMQPWDSVFLGCICVYVCLCMWVSCVIA